jgi:DNA polymerase-1
MEAPKLTGNDEKSVDAEARSLLKKQYPQFAPLVNAIDKHAKSEKLQSTYAGSWLRYVTPQNRVHSKYNQLEQRDEAGVPVTGRLSSTDPNAQNVAKKPVHLAKCACMKCAHEKGIAVGEAATVSIRRYYTVPSGFVRFYIDLSQIELRVLAWFTQDPLLLYCYANDMDVHQITADQVTGGDRDVAKTVNFGNNYGQTKFGLAKRLPHYAENPEQALEDAGRYLKLFFEKYAGVPVFKRNLTADMIANGCMFVSPFNRPRRIPEISSDDEQELARAQRKMMSSIISGTAADMIKEIMIRTGAVLEATYGHLPEEQRGRKVQTIHDENVYDLPIVGCSQVLPKLLACFTDWPQFEAGGVPIRASIEATTTTWEEKRGLEVLPDGSFKWAD